MVRAEAPQPYHERADTVFGRSRRRKSADNGLGRPGGRAAPRVEALEDRLVPTLLGQQLFPSDYPWNQNISNAPVAANSAAVIAHIGGTIGIHPDWGADSPSAGTSQLYGIPYNVVHGNSPAVTRVNVQIDNYPGESDVVPVPMSANPVIEGDFQGGPNLNGGGYNTGQRGDSHLIVWDVDNNVAYELYGATRPADPTIFPNTSGVELTHTDGQWHAAQESVWRMSAESFRPLGNTSADAAGLSILAGLARPDEGLTASLGGQGAINHALRFTLPSGDVAPQYIYPASHVVSTSASSVKLPFGARLRLMNTPAVNNAIATLGPQAQAVARAMQQYGLVLADIGSAMYVSGASGSVDASNALALTWDMNDVLGLRALKASYFEVVNLTPVVTGLSASSGAPGTTLTITGQNFSGAAGNLRVLFGSTPATAVTFVDDAHLTAVVPNGSGTVHVQVVSGVNATDPNNPNDNVNNPIFGYGASALTAADQFSYGAQPNAPLLMTALASPFGAGQASLYSDGELWLSGPGGSNGLLDSGSQAIATGQTAAGQPALFDLKTNGSLYQYSAAGWALLDNGAKSLVGGVTAAGAPAVFDLKPNGWLYQYAAGGWSLLDNGAKTIFGGVSAAGQPALFDLKPNGGLYQYTAGGWSLLDNGAGTVLSGVTASGGPALFDLKPGGGLYQYGAGGWSLLDNGAAAIYSGVTAAGQPALFDQKTSGWLYQYSVGGWVLLDNGAGTVVTGVLAVGQPILFDLKPGIGLYQYGVGGWVLLDNTAKAIVGGVTAAGQPALFDLKTNGWLYQFSQGAWALLDNQTAAIQGSTAPSGYPALFDTKQDGRVFMYTVGGFVQVS
jgi:hypothetical protein